MKAYIFEKSEADQREPHNTGVYKSAEDLAQIGVLYWQFNGDDALDRINALAVERKYKNRDEIVVSPEAMGPVYEEKVKSFFAEHLHEDEEIRFILDGSGFFDVRDKNDVWIRIHLEKGEMIVLPAGMYHRFTTDSNNYIKAMRLFKEDPQWTPINRPLADENQHRFDYLKTFNITV